MVTSAGGPMGLLNHFDEARAQMYQRFEAREEGYPAKIASRKSMLDAGFALNLTAEQADRMAHQLAVVREVNLPEIRVLTKALRTLNYLMEEADQDVERAEVKGDAFSAGHFALESIRYQQRAARVSLARQTLIDEIAAAASEQKTARLAQERTLDVFKSLRVEYGQANSLHAARSTDFEEARKLYVSSRTILHDDEDPPEDRVYVPITDTIYYDPHSEYQVP